MDRIRIVLTDGESLICGRCNVVVHGVRHPEGEEATVWVGDPEEMDYVVLCNMCAETDEEEDFTGNPCFCNRQPCVCAPKERGM